MRGEGGEHACTTPPKNRLDIRHTCRGTLFRQSGRTPSLNQNSCIEASLMSFGHCSSFFIKVQFKHTFQRHHLYSFASIPNKQILLILTNALSIASLKPWDDVSLHECFDSMPNLIVSGPARSTHAAISTFYSDRYLEARRTIDPVPICPRGSETCPFEMMPSTQPTGTEFPCLCPLEQFICEELGILTAITLYHQPKTE